MLYTFLILIYDKAKVLEIMIKKTISYAFLSPLDKNQRFVFKC